VVAADFRAAAVFQQFGIDFCCGGKKSIAQACDARQVPHTEVLTAIQRVCAVPARSPHFSEWEADALADFIVRTHHRYVRDTMPALLAYTSKLARVHGERHPELLEVAALTENVAAEMTSHMAKEERVLFPYIVALAETSRAGEPVPPAPFGSIDDPIRMMEDEHESAGGAMARIRKLTRDYTPPADGCTTYRVCLETLKAFEADLHAHVHLENNILFPRAKGLAARTA
jgi:regulator of cell morphogenesis and NO signaling